MYIVVTFISRSSDQKSAFSLQLVANTVECGSTIVRTDVISEAHIDDTGFTDGFGIVVDIFNTVCGCGNKGCLEQYASATGIVNMAKENVPEGSYLADKKVTAKAVFDGAKEGDAYCMKVVEKFGRYLGVALSNVAHVVDPEAFVIGGGVSAAGQILLDVVEKYYNENSMFALKNKSFHLAELGNDAGIYGAVRMVLFK